MIVELNARSKEVFRQIVDAYVATGEPVGSRTIARRLDEQVSPATIRNVMADLEEVGPALRAPHLGRPGADRRRPAALRRRPAGGRQRHRGGAARDRGPCAVRGRSIEGVLSDASNALSALSRYAGIVTAPINERPFRHIEFVPLSPGRALVDRGRRQRHGREPGHRRAAGHVGVDPDRGRQLPDRAARRPQLRRGARPASWTRSSSTAASSTR